MKKIDEKYFIKKDEKEIKNISDILSIDEKVLLELKPKKKAFVFEQLFSFLIPSVIFVLMDVGIIVAMSVTGLFSRNPFFTIFFIPFILIHLFPLWVLIYRSCTVNKVYENTLYVLTDKRIIIRTGLRVLNFKSIFYSDIVGITIRVGKLDKMFKVGDIYITAACQTGIINDIEDPLLCVRKIQQISSSIKSDISYPNNLASSDNNIQK